MPENEFEKKVQQRMDELQLTPSDEVWMEVAQRIGKAKKKRRIFMWLPLLCLLLGGGIAIAIWQRNNNNSIVKSDKAINKRSVDNKSVRKKPIAETLELRNNTVNVITEKEKSEQSNKSTTSIHKEVVKFSVPQEKYRHAAKSPLINKNSASVQYVRRRKNNIRSAGKNSLEKQNSGPIVRNNEIAEQQNNKETTHGGVDDVSVAIKKTESAMEQKDSAIGKIIPVIEKVNELVAMKKDSSASQHDSTNIIATEKPAIRLHKKIEKWRLGFMFAVGRSQIADGPTFFDKNYRAADILSNPSSASAGGGQPVTTYTQSPIEASLSFSAGAFIQRSVSKRLDINIGLSYSYLSTKMNIGSKVDSSFSTNNASLSVSLNNFYRVSNSNFSHTNKYHFIALSAGLSWKLIHRKKISVSWTNAFNYDRLLSSDALHFSGSIPGYYKNDNLLTHNHLFLSTGFSIPVFKRFELNPFAAYSLTAVVKNAGSANTHFTNYGIRVNFLLDNKK